MTWRVVIVDDERLSRVALRELLHERGDVAVAGEACDVASAVSSIGEHSPDLVFLDIALPDGSGFDVLERLDSVPAVVFVTAFDGHALRAFDVNAIDYLMKPVDPDYLDRVFRRLGDGAVRPSRTDVSLTEDDIVCLQEAQRMRVTSVRDIAYIVAADDYAEVHLLDGAAVLVKERLRRWELRLPDSFQRTHRSILVNLRHVSHIEQSSGRWSLLIRGSGRALPMSRRYTRALRRRLGI